MMLNSRLSPLHSLPDVLAVAAFQMAAFEQNGNHPDDLVDFLNAGDADVDIHGFVEWARSYAKGNVRLLRLLPEQERNGAIVRAVTRYLNSLRVPITPGTLTMAVFRVRQLVELSRATSLPSSISGERGVS
jgi:hypothetical protein